MLSQPLARSSGYSPCSLRCAWHRCCSASLPLLTALRAYGTGKADRDEGMISAQSNKGIIGFTKLNLHIGWLVIIVFRARAERHRRGENHHAFDESMAELIFYHNQARAPVQQIGRQRVPQQMRKHSPPDFRPPRHDPQQLPHALGIKSCYLGGPAVVRWVTPVNAATTAEPDPNRNACLQSRVARRPFALFRCS